MMYDHMFKFLLIGNSAVGKSSMLSRYTEDIYPENAGDISTIGVDLKIKTLEIDGKIYKIQIWDTAGQERFRSITASYYRGTHGIAIVYDITDRESFDKIKYWTEEITRNNSNDSVSIVLIGNKSDLDGRKVSYKEASDLAESFGINFFEVSAKNNKGINEAFLNLTISVLKKEYHRLIQAEKDINKNAEMKGLIYNFKDKYNHISCCDS